MIGESASCGISEQRNDLTLVRESRSARRLTCLITGNILRGDVVQVTEKGRGFIRLGIADNRAPTTPSRTATTDSDSELAWSGPRFTVAA
jgi:hypothetical protein